MRILLVHNKYQQKGGEDSLFQSERKLLEDAGHRVFVYEKDNAEISAYDIFKKISLFKNTSWSVESKKEIEEIIRSNRPDIAHFHNTFPLVSPSGYYACKEAGVPIVQTLHNYRLLCPNSMFFRDNHICEDCLGKTPPWPGVLHACYRDSRVETAAVASMLTYHRIIQTWNEKVDVFIAVSNFAREKFIQGRLPADKITVKPNFVPDPGIKEEVGQVALFVGRLSQEKGVLTLLEAWKDLVDVRLNIVGDGPLFGEVLRFVTKNKMKQVRVLGRLSRDKTLEQYKQARFLVVPSECYENFPMVIVEAFACGLPVIATGIGAMKEIITSEKNGLHFSLADARDLAEKVTHLWSSPEEAVKMGIEARHEFVLNYTEESSYKKLEKIYKDLLK